ncbi:hypothetical protein CYMTET_30502 [Cymbomonas tetramitiformis]|uniref:MYND-type domain-containing protein n=1 Tax=Cymbomonas tetramitiformis TaxID=36881 RepID=A0AAE0KTV5_9CHLO|nr:hypothetical protein CYMTET_30502 [Cymbomonas tetramitiformis]
MSSLKRKLDDSPLHSWECQLCGRPATSACKGCGAFYYCRPKHQALHWKLHHHSECDRLKCQMRQSETLQQFPFTFTRETTAKVDMLEVTECSFLRSRGLHGQGIWRRECACSQEDAAWGTLSTTSCAWALPSSSVPRLDTSPGFEGAPPGIADWEAYYRLRQLPLDSPVALVLDVALTLYHVLCTSFKQQFAEAFLSKSLLPLTVHVLGAQRELDQLDALRELSSLLPHALLHIHFIGPDVPRSRDSEEAATWTTPHGDLGKEAPPSGTGRVSLHHGLYHAVRSKLPEADLVFAPNAGIAAYPSWLPTVDLFAAFETPFFITDFCEEAALLAVEILTAAGVELDYQISPNPFRRPFSKRSNDNALPAYSNGFLFGRTNRQSKQDDCSKSNGVSPVEQGVS